MVPDAQGSKSTNGEMALRVKHRVDLPDATADRPALGIDLDHWASGGLNDRRFSLDRLPVRVAEHGGARNPMREKRVPPLEAWLRLS
jgi:hypothetical protein